MTLPRELAHLRAGRTPPSEGRSRLPTPNERYSPASCPPIRRQEVTTAMRAVNRFAVDRHDTDQRFVVEAATAEARGGVWQFRTVDGEVVARVPVEFVRGISGAVAPGSPG